MPRLLYPQDDREVHLQRFRERKGRFTSPLQSGTKKGDTSFARTPKTL